MKIIDIAKRNYWFMIIEGGFYFTGWTFFDVFAVIPVFVDSLTGDLKLAGLAATLKMAVNIVPQLFMGHYTPRVKNLVLFLGGFSFATRVCFFLVPVILLTNLNPYVKVYALYFFVMLCAFGDGIGHVPWIDIFGRTIPAERRGRLLGYQQLIGGMGGLAAGSLLKIVLGIKGWNVSSRFALIFSIGAAILTTAGILLFFLRDVQRPAGVRSGSLFNYLFKLHKYILKNKKFFRLSTTQCLFYFNGLASPIYILFAKKHFGLPPGTVASLVFAQILGTLAGGIIWGNMSFRLGNKKTIQAGISVNILVAGLSLALSAGGHQPVIPLLMAIAFGSGTLLGAWLGFTNYMLEIVSEEERPVYTAINATIQFPFTLMTFLGGVLADMLGFLPVFAAVTAVMCLCLLSSARLESNP